MKWGEREREREAKNAAFQLVLELTAYNLGKFKVVLNSVLLKDFWSVCKLFQAQIIGWT